jgi:hypothetical protein
VRPLGYAVVHQTGPVDCPVRLLRVLCPLRAQARIKCVAVDRCAQSSEREMCPWAISKYFGDLVSNTSA